MASKNTPVVRTGKFSIRELSNIVGDKDMVHELHRHDYYFILCVEKGSGTHEIDFISHAVADRSVFLLRPGQVHRLALQAGAVGFLLEFDHAFYQPSGTIGEARWKKAISKNYCEPSPDIFLQLIANLTQAYLEYDSKADGYAEAISACLDLFFLSWLRGCTTPLTAEPTPAGYAQERYDELLQMLETNIATEKSASRYAKMLHLSLYQLNAITKSVAGKTVSGLINDQILLEAKRHLLGTTAQVKDIASDLGFEDVSYFVRFFRKHTGRTPDTFRKNS